MFTDIVGYTALTQAGESQAMKVLDRHNRLLRPVFPKFHGTEVKSIGDSFLVEFESALDAIRCAAEIQSFLHDYNISSKEEWKIKLRIGIHLGDVIHQKGDVFGDAVNIASRLEPEVGPEEIGVSQQVYDQVQNKFDLPLVSLGERALKNVDLPVNVYKVQMPWEGRDYTRPGLAANRFAVLPFVNMSSDPEDAFFADGITEEIISTTSKIQGLDVISRTSVMRYKQSTKSTQEIGRELNAGKLLEGSVRKSGNRLRIAVQLIDAEKDRHVWAENYDRELQDVFAIQTDVAHNVASHLAKGIANEVERRDTEDIEAYTLYMRAMQLYHESTERGLTDAISLFEQAVARDPRFVRAHAGLAQACFWLAYIGHEEWTRLVQKLEVAARRAVGLGPEWAESHVALAYYYGAVDRIQEEISEAQEATRINPNLSEAYSVSGIGNASQGSLDEALGYLRRSCELDPLQVDANFALYSVAMNAGRMDEAFDVLARMRGVYPANPRVFQGLAEFYMRKRDFAEAQEMIDHGRKLDPDYLWLRAQQGILYAKTERKEEAQKQLEEIMRHERSETMRLTAQLFINAALGNIDEAFEALMRQAELHSWDWLIKTDPLVEPLRKDPRFAEFCKKVGLPA